MTEPSPRTAEPSRSAILVAQARALARGRLLPGRFDDPVAERLLDADERAAVERARCDQPPASFAERLPWEMLRATAEHMAVRTVAVDDAVLAAGHPQVVLLGAGLDARAWRLSASTDATFFEVDRPASQAGKRRRVEAAVPPLPQGRPRYVAVDLATTPLAPALTGAGFDPQLSTTWVWEGVVMYLTPTQVADTVAQLASLSSPGSLVVVHYTARSLLARVGRMLYRRAARQTGADPFAQEPNRSAWRLARLEALLAAHGFEATSDRSLLNLAADLGLAPTRPGSLRAARLLLATRVRTR